MPTGQKQHCPALVLANDALLLLLLLLQQLPWVLPSCRLLLTEFLPAPGSCHSGHSDFLLFCLSSGPCFRKCPVARSWLRAHSQGQPGEPQVPLLSSASLSAAGCGFRLSTKYPCPVQGETASQHPLKAGGRMAGHGAECSGGQPHGEVQVQHSHCYCQHTSQQHQASETDKHKAGQEAGS